MLGLVYSFLYNSRSLINQFIVPAELSVKYNSIKEILISASTLASPLVVNYAVESLGYSLSFKYLMYIYGVIAFAILLIKISKIHQIFIFHKLIGGIFTNKTIRNISIIKFSSGIGFAMAWGLLNILILQQLGSLEGWTKVSIVMAILGIIVSYVL